MRSPQHDGRVQVTLLPSDVELAVALRGAHERQSGRMVTMIDTVRAALAAHAERLGVSILVERSRSPDAEPAPIRETA